MKTAISILLFWAVASLHATEPEGKSSCSATPNSTNRFELVKQENNISIYTRWIPVEEKRSARQVKVTFAIDAPVEKVLSVLADDSSFTTWMKGTREYRRVYTVDSGNWYSYIQFSIPWPLNNQDCIIHYEMREHSGTYTEIYLNGEPGYLAAVDGVTRISHMEGAWRFVSAGPDRTLVEYVIFSKQPSSFPRWITDPIIQNNMIKTMTAFREQVSQVGQVGQVGQVERRAP
ncbi:MAG: SRPBCC family protein [Bacteroidales bacterium]|nr:SRPBCC family protein [Bacteroidales bacterium]